MECNAAVLHQRLNAARGHIVDIPNLKDDPCAAINLGCKRIKILTRNIVPGFRSDDDQITLVGWIHIGEQITHGIIDVGGITTQSQTIHSILNNPGIS